MDLADAIAAKSSWLDCHFVARDPENPPEGAPPFQEIAASLVKVVHDHPDHEGQVRDPRVLQMTLEAELAKHGWQLTNHVAITVQPDGSLLIQGSDPAAL